MTTGAPASHTEARTVSTIEQIPLPDNSVDVVISNCVINLSADKPVLREAARVLKPGGRFAVSDVIADPDMDEAKRADIAQWTGCIADALTRDEFARARRRRASRRRHPGNPPLAPGRRVGDRSRHQARPRMRQHRRPSRLLRTRSQERVLRRHRHRRRPLRLRSRLTAAKTAWSTPIW